MLLLFWAAAQKWNGVREGREWMKEENIRSEEDEQEDYENRVLFRRSVE